jgi:hypothetical protein
MLLRSALVLAGVLAATAAPAAATPPLSACERGLVPTGLHLSIGGFPAGNRGIDWNPSLHALVIRDVDLGGHQLKPRVVRPSCQRWQAFWRALDRYDVWDWRPSYVNTHILDGWWWSVQLERRGASVSSHGSNDSPGSWEHFARSVSALIAPLHFTIPPLPTR